MPLSKIDSDSLNTPITAADLAYTGTLTGSTGIVNIGSGQVYKDASGNVGIGTSSPNRPLSIQRGAGVGAYIDMAGNGNTLGSTSFVIGQGEDDTAYVYNRKNSPMAFATNNTERARIDSSGNLLVGTTSASPGYGNTNTGVQISGSGSTFSRGANDYVMVVNQNTADGSNYYQMVFRVANVTKGTIISTSTATAYNTSSDYRLKNTIAPMTGALAKVALLKPCTYKWKVDGSDGQGFIAHELDEVVPGCVTGEKDAVDAEGNPVHQGIDTSFLVATLTAAIQELKAIVDGQAVLIAAQGVEIAALKGTP